MATINNTSNKIIYVPASLTSPSTNTNTTDRMHHQPTAQPHLLQAHLQQQLPHLQQQQQLNISAQRILATPTRVTPVGHFSHISGSGGSGAAPPTPTPSIIHSIDISEINYKRNPRGSERNKGLRHFSKKVCEKVREKGRTTYNEVADELVSEYFELMSRTTNNSSGQHYSHEQRLFDQKNIRRRVYDALNVLMAMNIMKKEKKEILWLGLPLNLRQECWKLDEEKARRVERVREKLEQIQELIIQQVAFKSLVERNKVREQNSTAPPPPIPSDNNGGLVLQQQQQGLAMPRLTLPYIVVSTSNNTVIDCSISSDKSEYLFTFDRPFELHDDVEVLKRLGMALGLENGNVSENKLQLCLQCLPPSLHHYVKMMARDELGVRVGRHFIKANGQVVASRDDSLPKGVTTATTRGVLVEPQKGITSGVAGEARWPQQQQRSIDRQIMQVDAAENANARLAAAALSRTSTTSATSGGSGGRRRNIGGGGGRYSRSSSSRHSSNVEINDEEIENSNDLSSSSE